MVSVIILIQMAKKNERRQKLRVPVQNNIRHTEYQVLGTPVFQENATLDLSSGGVSFEARREYSLGDLVLLEFKVEKEVLKLLVCVAWVKPTQDPEVFQIGGELVAMSPVDKRKMNQHLSKMLVKIEKTKAQKAKAQKAKAKKKTTLKKPGTKKSRAVGTPKSRKIRRKP